MTAPKVYAAITAITESLAARGIAKRQTNRQEGYAFRGIDDVYAALSPLLAKNSLCILPKMLERTAAERVSTAGNVLVSVTLKAAFDFVSAIDGSAHTVVAYGEALDTGDKATSKASSSAFKYAVLQAFCIPISGREDADADSYQLSLTEAEPVQGWEQFARDVSDLVGACESHEAIDRVQNVYRPSLRQMAASRPELYQRIGEAVAGRRSALAPASTGGTPRKKVPRSRVVKPKNGKIDA